VNIAIDSLLIRDDEPKGAELDDGTVVVLSVRAASYFGFNPVAGEIWKMLAVPRRIDQIFSALAESYEVDAELLARDVTPFLQTLVEHRLIRMIAPDKPS
jgi:Coenzyme PQQ synthesis protein D (PqqD)